MVTKSWQTAIPTEPDPRYVEVDHIALSADEGTVRNFFAFCGPIEHMELKKEANGTQSALIKFSNVEAAKTSLLLSNAQINHENIGVSALFPQALSPSTPPTYATDSANQQPSASGSPSSRNPIEDANYEGKPALYVVHELLAAGYFVGEHVVSRASEFDSKYRVVNRTQEQARSLDNQYKFSAYLQHWDDKFKISQRAKDAYNKIQDHPVGQKVILTVNDAYQSALQLSQDAHKIADRKRAQNEQLFGKIPLPRSPTADKPQATASSPSYDAPAASGQANNNIADGPTSSGPGYTDMSAPNVNVTYEKQTPTPQPNNEKNQ